MPSMRTIFLLVAVASLCHADDLGLPGCVELPAIRMAAGDSFGWCLGDKPKKIIPGGLIRTKDGREHEKLEAWLDEELDLYYPGILSGLRLGRGAMGLSLGHGTLGDLSGIDLKEKFDSGQGAHGCVFRLGLMRPGQRIVIRCRDARFHVARIIRVGRQGLILRVVSADEATNIWIKPDDWREKVIPQPDPKVQLSEEDRARKHIIEMATDDALTIERACEEVSKMIEKGMLIEAKAGTDFTLLQIASAKGSVPVVTALLEAGAKADFIAKDGATALHSAAYFGHVEVCRLLLQHGARFDVVDRSNVTPVELARQRGHQEVIDLFVAAGGAMKLREAVSAMDEARVKAILDEGGADKGELHRALHASIDVSCAAIFALLLKSGVDPFNESYHGSGSAFDRAVGAGHVDMVKQCIELADKERLVKESEALFSASSPEMVRLLIDAGLEYGRVDNPESAMSMITEYGTREMLAAHAGCLPVLPLWSLVRVGETEKVLKLLSGLDEEALKENVLLNDSGKRNVLHYASATGDLRVAKAVVNKGVVSINGCDDSGQTPLHHAVMNRRGESALWLLGLPGIKIDATDADGFSPLALAVQQGSLDLVRMLIDKSADTGVVPRGEKSLLDLTQRDSKVYKLLLQAGVK